MRRELAKSEGERKRFKAVFSKLGKKINYKGYSEDTLLLTDIVDLETNTRVSDHVWFSYTIGFQEAAIKVGDSIEFVARIKKYTKGYANKKYQINQQRLDYKLSHPTKIKLIKI